MFPWLGKRPIAELRAPELLTILRRIESRGTKETAHRVKQNCGQVFRYAVATGRADRDPTGDLRGALPPTKPKHHASIVDPKGVGQLLRALDGYEGQNLGHEEVLTTLYSYGYVAPQRQGEIIQALGDPRPSERSHTEAIAEAVARHLRRSEPSVRIPQA